LNKEIHENIIETEKILLNINEVDAIEYSIWTKEKAKLKYNGIISNFPIYNNFIYWCNLGINIGSEQNKIRPVIIVGSTIKSPIAIIIPLTSKRLKDEFWYHIDLEKLDSTALVEQLRVISKIRIISPFRQKGKMVVISKLDWNKINRQLQVLYRLKPLKNI
jgi:mRNA interferase MazF